jgi:hypothetical protein
MRQLTQTCLLVLALSACGGALKYDLRGTQLSPSSDAKLVAEVDESRNLTELELKASNLTPPDRLIDGGTTYVAWQRRDSDTPWSRLGALELSDEGRTGVARLSVAEVAFDLLVSAEQDATVASPSGKTVFEQRVAK